MLFTGNFAFAVTHLDCMADNNAHHKCEMECCIEGDCCPDEEITNSATGAMITGNSCCEVHIEQAVLQDDAILLITKTPDNRKFETLKTGLSVQQDYKQDFTRLTTHRFKTTNIYLSVSNLRI